MSTTSTLQKPIAKDEKRRIFFKCSKCNRTTDAPPETQRSIKNLCRECYGKGKDRRPRELNELTGALWAQYSKSVESYPDTRTDKQRLHGACFPKSLALQHIEIFTKRGDIVLDPFVGVGTTLEAAQELGRKGVGVELNSEFAKLARHGLGKDQKVICGDARQLLTWVKRESVNLILTSPPYANLLKTVRGDFAFKWREHSTINPISNPRPYSTKKEDLGNLAYPDFLSAIGKVLESCREALIPGGYAVWIVKDFRDLKKSLPYVNFHGDVINAANQAGLTLWDIRIYDQTKFRPLVCLGFPSRNFYLNLGHSYVLTFRKV